MRTIKSRLVLGAAFLTALLAGLGFLAGERYGLRKAIRDGAPIAEKLSAVTIELEALKKQRSSAESAGQPANDAIPYTASDQELSEQTALFRAIGGLILPKRFYIAAGQTVEIYWKGIVLAQDPETFTYGVSCTCNFANNKRRGIELSPQANASGTYTLEVTVSDTKDEKIDRRKLELIVVPRNAGADEAFEMLMVGDSLGHQSRFPNYLAHLLSEPQNPRVTFVGSHKPNGAEIPHEQYGGWRFRDFTERYGVDPKVYYTDRSPFVFGLVDGKPQVDVQRYLDETLRGARPRNVHIQLGINDAFGLSPKSPDLDKQLRQILDDAEALIAALRKALPEAIITVGSVIPANASDRAFIESYRPAAQLHSEWRWRQVQMRLARLMVDHFEEASSRKIYLVPTHMTVDPLDGYNAHIWIPEGVDYKLSNAVHPSQVGDKQLAEAIYAVLKAGRVLVAN